MTYVDPFLNVLKRRKVETKDLIYKTFFYEIKTEPSGKVRSLDTEKPAYCTNGFLDSYVARPFGAVNQLASGRTFETPTDTLYIRKPVRFFVDIGYNVICRKRRFVIYTIENLQNVDQFLRIDMFEIAADTFQRPGPTTTLKDAIEPF